MSTTGASVSVSVQNGNGHGDYAGVTEQSGIVAGTGGFDVNVSGNTDLKGGVISSAADPGKNSLTTGTLSFSDIQNHSDFTATSTGFSEGLSSDIGSSNHPSHGTASVPGGGGGIPTYAHDSGSSSSTTRSAVGAGQIQVTDANHQAQDVANLSRDTAGTNGAVSKLPDVNSTIAQQADLMNAVSAAGEAVATKIGDYADSKRDDAIKEAKAAQDRGDLDAMRGYLDEAKSWDEGGSNRTMLHVAGGGLIGGLGGGGVGSAMQGAAGAGLASSLAGTTKQIADAIGAETGSDLLGKLAGNTLAGIGGGIVGGTTGAAAAANVNLYNQWRDSGSTDIDTLERAAGISDGGKRTSTLERILQGIALAANAVLGMEGGPPPGASPSAVLVNSAAGALPAQALAGQGIAPSHAIFNDGGGKATDTAANEVSTVVDTRKFSDYIFKPGADHGKNVVFESLGYTADDSATLSEIWQTQAAQKYANGDFTLGKADQYGQRINIEIALPGKGGASRQTSYLQSGWMIQPDGSLKLNTPFSGFTRSRP